MVKVVYLDTSAAMKVIVAENESTALVNYLISQNICLVSGLMLYTELHCAAGRIPEDISAEKVQKLLDTVELVEMQHEDYIKASSLQPLRSADALHLAVAQRCGADIMLSYDAELIEASLARGLAGVSPA